MELHSSVEVLKGVGPATKLALSKAGVNSVYDLLTYYPRRYDDFSVVTNVAQLKPGQVTIRVQIKQVVGRYARRGLHITEAVASDKTGSVRIVWFNQPYRAAQLQQKKDYYVSGVFGLQNNRLTITNPSCELVSDFPINAARLIPVYREKKNLTSVQLRKIVGRLFASNPHIPETLPRWLLKAHKLISLQQALEYIHFPQTQQQLSEARVRLGFEEVFGLTLAAQLNKQENEHGDALVIPFNKELAKKFVDHLDFSLTDAQRKAIWQVYQDMTKPLPMNRLLEGDVGAGKTVVAAMAALMVLEQGFQVAFMAPTELLARQHAETLYSLLQPLGYAKYVALLVGSLPAKQKKTSHQRIADGEARFVVGTHALISEKLDMHKLGLVIVDEQHRFGVQQRKKLQAKAGHAVHALQMTATPIPRSLALTVYGDLDVSVLDQKPKNRKPIITELCSPNSRQALYKRVDSALEQGRQCFVVCQTIEENDITKKLSVQTAYNDLRRGYFKHRHVGLLHGRMTAAEKSEVMQDFVNQKIDILVATTVIEVGVDVPNATVMVVENADTFGLAQLHQLRGRVGRSSHQGYCYLMLSDSSAPSPRLRAIASSNDGFRLAELDLELRGPGSIYGNLQHGALDLRIAELTNTRLISDAQAAAKMFLARGENLLEYKELAERVTRLRAVTNLN